MQIFSPLCPVKWVSWVLKPQLGFENILLFTSCQLLSPVPLAECSHAMSASLPPIKEMILKSDEAALVPGKEEPSFRLFTSHGSSRRFDQGQSMLVALPLVIRPAAGPRVYVNGQLKRCPTMLVGEGD